MYKTRNVPSSIGVPQKEKDIGKYLEELETKVTEEYPKKMECLLNLKEKMTSSSCFDSEDLEWVNGELSKLTKEFECLKNELKFKHKMYHETLSGMEETLKRREDALNETNNDTELFHLYPNLVQKFAMKQAELVKSKEMLKDQLYENWSTTEQ